MYVRAFERHFSPEFAETLRRRHEGYTARDLHAISFLHVEVAEYLARLPLNFKMEEKFLGFDVDIVFYDADFSAVTGVMEINGYQHFLRNVNVLSGDALLKRKILAAALGGNVFEMEIYTWELIDIYAKPQFLKDMLKPVLLAAPAPG